MVCRRPHPLHFSVLPLPLFAINKHSKQRQYKKIEIDVTQTNKQKLWESVHKEMCLLCVHFVFCLGPAVILLTPSTTAISQKHFRSYEIYFLLLTTLHKNNYVGAVTAFSFCHSYNIVKFQAKEVTDTFLISHSRSTCGWKTPEFNISVYLFVLWGSTVDLWNLHLH